MPAQANDHIKKFNQLVDVYEPDGVDQIDNISSRASDQLEQRRAEISGYRERVESLRTTDFFDEQRRDEIRTTESMPDPSEVAESHREDLLERLEYIEESLSTAISDGEMLDLSDDLE